MYSMPETLFTADFMGSNNRLPGRVTEISNGDGLLEGDGWRLWGMAKRSAAGPCASETMAASCAVPVMGRAAMMARAMRRAFFSSP